MSMLCGDAVLVEIVAKLKKQFPDSEISVRPNEKVSVLDSMVLPCLRESIGS